MARKIVGRVREKEILKNALKSQRSELIAVYGRRRIGKTFLIREFYEKEMAFSFTGYSDGSRAVQLKNFMAKLQEKTEEFKDEKPKDWIDGFGLLKKYISRQRKTKVKKVIFIDEFPWIASRKSGFLAAFENFWNDFCAARTDIVVVICGSAASYMVKKIIRNNKGLSKRITQKIELKPFTLKEVKEFFESKGISILQQELLRIYMTFGGVPEYLEQIQRGDSAVSSIDRLCFEPGAYLENEFDEVFESLFDTSSFHKMIINALADGKKKGMSRTNLLKKCKVESSGRFSQSLLELEMSGFILKYDAYRGKSKEILYRIVDEFCLFYLKFMKPFKGSRWLQLYQKPAYSIWCGYAFEGICLKHVNEIKRVLKIEGVVSKNYAWHNEKAQIDLVIDRDDKWINLIEAKFYNEAFEMDEAYYKKLETKKIEFKKDKAGKKGIFISLITTQGVAENKYSTAILDHNLTIDCLF